ncbi:hypothetical protein [Microvirga splendida]|uniref:hypothetical protein n=1 Tax=Microvirga splendida TaxID=2795727 RepID=UPI003CCF909E
MAMFETVGPDLHVMAVCQPAAPVLAATALMEARRHPRVPRSATLLGGPVDPGRAPTAVTAFAREHDITWFGSNCIRPVPLHYPGRGRLVYPGFLQLSGFMAVNPDRHLSAHWKTFSRPRAERPNRPSGRTASSGIPASPSSAPEHRSCPIRATRVNVVTTPCCCRG